MRLLKGNNFHLNNIHNLQSSSVVKVKFTFS